MSRFNYTVPSEVERGFHRHLLWGRWEAVEGLPTRNVPLWRGIMVIKHPADLLLYHEAIYRTRPQWIVETGTDHGGSALFFGDMCEILGQGHVISVDRSHGPFPPHPRVQYLQGDSVDPRVVEQIYTRVGQESALVTLDSKHTAQHVSKELVAYSPLVRDGHYLVVEDAYDARSGRAYDAVEAFLAEQKDWERIPVERQFLICATRLGWLRRKNTT